MSAAPPVYAQARAETAAMLGYDLANLTAEQATRLDVAAALRLAVDDQSGKLARGETADVTRLLSASEALAKLLPPLREPPPAANRVDPRQIMLDTYMGMRKRGELADPCSTYEGMKAEVERLRAEIAALKAGAENSAPDVSAPGEVNSPRGEIPPAPAAPAPGDNVVKLSPRGDNSSPPAADVVVDLRASRANGAGGSAGFRVGPADDPWRRH
jgi:hypothetical protein